MPKSHHLPVNTFTTIVEHTPLISVDLLMNDPHVHTHVKWYFQ
jgi:hypothetical protein